jgi:hypothetical protein
LEGSSSIEKKGFQLPGNFVGDPEKLLRKGKGSKKKSAEQIDTQQCTCQGTYSRRTRNTTRNLLFRNLFYYNPRIIYNSAKLSSPTIYFYDFDNNSP